MKALWVARPANEKTGVIPTAYIGETKEDAWRSCEGCRLRDGYTDPTTGRKTRCYAWNGTVANMGFPSVRRGYASNPDRYTAAAAIAKRARTARAIRFGALGDPSAVDAEEITTTSTRARDLGLAVLGYTHHWRKTANAWLAKHLMASCDNLADADRAIGEGWVPAAVVDQFATGTNAETTPAGSKLMQCPAQRSDGRTQCNDCRLCDPQNPFWTKQTTYRGIAFADHGPGSIMREKA